MSEEMLVRHCSPTLAGLKTGNIFSCTYDTADEMKESMRHFNKRLVRKGLRILPLRFRDNRALIYVYRPSRLMYDLQQKSVCGLLKNCGYCTEFPERCLKHLIKRIGENSEFPHEIGLFLGYPTEDVRGFIENRPDCKCTGCWKVYGDVEAACRIFAKYKKCTDIYSRLLAEGTSIERLIVAS